MDDYSIVVTNERKEILNEFRKRGLLVNQRDGTQRLRKQLQGILIREHPIQKLLGESKECKGTKLDNDTIKGLHSQLHLAKSAWW